MANSTERRGGCLCGAVHLIAKSDGNGVEACHCDMCRRWGGGPFMAIDAGTDVSIDGAENVSVFDSSDWAERGFCRTCGSHLFYRLKQTGRYIVPAGVFGGEDGLVLEHQLFIDRKPGYYAFANDTENLTGEEVFAKFAPPG
mgnify:CR=1 FL=1